MFLWLSYFSQISFGFSCIRLLVCFRVISSQLLIIIIIIIIIIIMINTKYICYVNIISGEQNP